MRDNQRLGARRTNPADRSEFLVVWASDLENAGIEVMRWVRPFAQVARRDGPSVWRPHWGWIPFELWEEQTRENARVALTCAVRTVGDDSSAEDVLRLADSMFQWLQGPD